MPTPAELRAATEAARQRVAEAHAELERKESEKRKRYRQSIADEAEGYIETLDRYLGNAADNAPTDAKVDISIGGSFRWASDGIEFYRDLVKPRLEQYYEEQGFTVRWIENHTTGSDGAGPGPTYIKFEVSWDD